MVNAMSAAVRFLSDEQLLAECRVDVYRGSGPGGQKRNKTSNAYRLTHTASGLSVTATESRSAMENKLHAIRRMRLKLAAELREPVADRFEPPDWFLSIRHNGRIEASYRHQYHAATAGLILDLLKVAGNPSHVSAMLGVSTTTIIKFLESEPQLWAAANRIRTELSMKPLTHRD
jgi:hypothetical protein